MAITTGLSGNEIWCLAKKDLQPGNLVIGNSVYSLGFVGSLGAGIRTLTGGEVTQVTDIIREGRTASFERMLAWSDLHGSVGITGISSELAVMGSNVEFLSVGSCVHRPGYFAPNLEWSTSSDGQELYCQLDAGFQPRHFVFGNVAYSIGIGGGIGGAFRSLARGEVKEFSDIFNHTRHLAIDRIQQDAMKYGGNSVIGISTSIMKFKGIQEMVMIGTAAHHPLYPAAYDDGPATSDLTNEEAWNLANLGYLPIRLVLGVSVYSLGFVDGITAAFKSFARGEINEMTTLIYEARENALDHISQDAAACGADDVVGIKTYVYGLGNGMIEFVAIGTAVKKFPGVSTTHDYLPPQAVMRDKDTFINTAEHTLGRDLNKTGIDK
jgi:uncharacterized protein YbjQ (UPF0145 family)